MPERAILKTKFIPFRYLDRFNQIADTQIPGYEFSSSPARPGLLARSWLENLQDGELGLVEAYAGPGNRGFYVSMTYHRSMEEKCPGIRTLASRLRKAVTGTVGRRIRTTYVIE